MAEAAVLRLLTIVPFPSNDSTAGWSQGLELVPAGLLALKHINSTPYFLNGHTLELIVKEGEGCGTTVIVDDIYSLFQELSTPYTNVVGVVGLPCSTATGAVSKLAGHLGINLIQISGSMSPVLQDRTTYPRLYLAATSVGFLDSIISLMKFAQWRRLSVFHDEGGLYFQKIAQLLISSISSNNMTLDNIGTLTTKTEQSIVERDLEQPGIKRSKITVVVGTEQECSIFMCAAYRRGRTWPGYVYILPDRIVSDFQLTNTDCDAETMTKAIEGAFTVNIIQQSPDDAVLVSGIKYTDYRLEYLQELENYSIGNGYGLDLNGSIYANNLYDGVWSFALALNSSLQWLGAMNLSLENFTLNSRVISDTLEEALLGVSFQGAGGKITFKNDRAPITSNTLNQIINGRSVFLATYNGTFIVSENFTMLHLPSDSIDRFLIFDPKWFIISIVSICGLCLVLIMVNATLLLCYRNKKDIKASSPYLSLLMFIGCTLLTISILVFTFIHMSNMSDTAFSVLCNSQNWFLSFGINFILNTLFVRLFRVYRLFMPNNYRKGGRMWRDECLFIAVLLLTLYPFVVLLVWTVVDPYQKGELETYLDDMTPPYFEVKLSCTCRFTVLWLLLLFLYPMVMSFGCLLLAIQTRHVKREQFKDTKKVNFFISASLADLAALVPLWELLDVLQLYTWSHLVFSVAIITIPVFCQVILYSPKTFPYLCHCCCCLQHADTIAVCHPSQSKHSKTSMPHI